MNELPKDRLKRLRKEAGLTQAELAKLAGVTQSTIGNIESGIRGYGASVVEIARALGTQPAFLQTVGRGMRTPSEKGDNSHQEVDSSDLTDAPPLRPFKYVPVVGTVQAGDMGYLLELDHPPGHGDGYITYPARDLHSYALRVRGDSMRPRIKAGEFIVVEPNHQAQPGDDVMVALKDGRRMVKELLYIRDGEATFGSINNGHANITVPLQEIEKMHYVAAIIPRGAFYKEQK